MCPLFIFTLFIFLDKPGSTDLKYSHALLGLSSSILIYAISGLGLSLLFTFPPLLLPIQSLETQGKCA